MKSSIAWILVLALLALGFVWYDTRETRTMLELQTALTAERGALAREGAALKRRGAELENARKAFAEAEVRAPVASTPTSPPIPAPEPLRPGVVSVVPAGWSAAGNLPRNFIAGVDHGELVEGRPSAYIKGSPSNSLGAVSQTFSAEEYAGKRIRYTALVKTQDADVGAQLGLAAFGQQFGSILAADSTSNRLVKGTSDWQQVSIVMDVPPDTRSLSFNFGLNGAGEMWTNGVKLEEVGPEVPVTQRKSTQTVLPKAPRNLGFE